MEVMLVQRIWLQALSSEKEGIKYTRMAIFDQFIGTLL